ncbi:MAG: hypothetical protein QOH05_1807 [Acetobacteraceae bacterium]|jgi:hypothetical protein|nr:hypothetical protein [Acetobacteraceae bacterium]
MTQFCWLNSDETWIVTVSDTTYWIPVGVVIISQNLAQNVIFRSLRSAEDEFWIGLQPLLPRHDNGCHRRVDVNSA